MQPDPASYGRTVWQMQVPLLRCCIFFFSCVSFEACTAAPHAMRLFMEQALSASSYLLSRASPAQCSGAS